MCTRSEPLEPVRCVSLDCPWLFQRKKVEQQVEDIEQLQELILALELGDNTSFESQKDSDEEPQEDDGEKMNTGMVQLWDDISGD
jgi:DNA polymerase zeta